MIIKNSIIKKFFLFICVTIFFIPLVNNVVCYANSAQPPSIIFIINNPPDEISLIANGESADVEINASEMYNAFYFRENIAESTIVLEIKTKDFNKIIEFQPVKKYQHLYTINLDNMSISEGKLPSYVFLRASVRMALTLLTEGLLFWLFGFRKKKSWLVFLCTNVVTQLFLGLFLNNYTPFGGYGTLFTVLFAEVVVFNAEIIAYFIFIKEYNKKRLAAFVIVANLASLIAGSILLSSFSTTLLLLSECLGDLRSYLPISNTKIF